MTPLQEAIARALEALGDGYQHASVSKPDLRLILTAAEEAEKLRLVAENVYRVLGPNVPTCLECQGCESEWQEALNILRRDAPAACKIVDDAIAARALTAAPLKTTGDIYSDSKTQADRSADSTGKAGSDGARPPCESSR